MLLYNPRQAALVTCQGAFEQLGKTVEKHDILPCTWHSPASTHPPHYLILVQKNLMASKIISNSKSFVINFIPYGHVDTLKKAQGISGEYTEKCDELGVHETSCEKLVDCFRLKEALGWLECEVVDEKEIGDHTLFIGRVVHSQLVRDDLRPFHIEKDEFTTTLK